MTNDEITPRVPFLIRVSSLIRHSSFIIQLRGGILK